MSNNKLDENTLVVDNYNKYISKHSSILQSVILILGNEGQPKSLSDKWIATGVIEEDIKRKYNNASNIWYISSNTSFEEVVHNGNI